MEQYRIDEIVKQWKNVRILNPKQVKYGNQILYEMEQDLIAMRLAIDYLSDYLEYRKKIRKEHTFGDHDCDRALEILIKRVSKYSCPNNKKDQYKTKDNCPLKEKCKCLK